MRVLVTGSSGYVGHQIATRLARRGHSVIGSTRRPYTLEGVDIACGDHLDTDFVTSIMQRCDAVVHCAARTRGHSAEVFSRDNESLTAVLCREAQRLDKRFIHISSDQAVYQTGFYGKSKRACEEIVASEHANFAILRLTVVLGRYAPEMDSTLSKIIQRLHKGPVLVVPGDCQFPIAPVWIGDIEQALDLLLAEEKLPNDVFELCGPALSLASLINLFEQQLGLRRLRVRLPVRTLQAIARMLKPYELFARLPLDALLDLGAPIQVSNDKFVHTFGFEPTDTRQAVAQIEGFPQPSGKS